MTITAGYVTAVMLQLYSLARLNGVERPEPPIRRWIRRVLVTRTGLATVAVAGMCVLQIWLISGGSRDTVPLAALTGLSALAVPVVAAYELRRRGRESRDHEDEPSDPQSPGPPGPAARG